MRSDTKYIVLVIMNYFDFSLQKIESLTGSSLKNGLNAERVAENRKNFGSNALPKKRKTSFIKRLFSCLAEPTLVILEFAWIITVGVNIGKFLRTGDGDIYECVGIFIAIALSVGLTMIMEGKSEKAFELLGKEYDKVSVKVVRGGEITVIPKEEIVVGDVVIIETGDKIIADGRLIESRGLTVDESTLTGESLPVGKNADAKVKENAALAERFNVAYSGTFVCGGTGKMIVTAVGANAELGKIASDLTLESAVSAPLSENLTRLGKTVTIVGSIAASLAFILSVVKLVITGNVNFVSVQDCFIEAIVLIVAAVPEGLPTTAAISLTLNVLKLAKSNALIRKLVAAETVGCVSIICSDKTGTLTENKMTVVKIGGANGRESEDKIAFNSAVNSTAEIKIVGGKREYFGSATECALLADAEKRGVDYVKARRENKVDGVVPFDSSYKYMSSVVNGKTYLKGAPEVVLDKCLISKNRSIAYLKEISAYQSEGKRVIAFASGNAENGLDFDGFAVISDPVRKNVKEAVTSCKNAGIRVIVMTGDNAATATAVANELSLLSRGGEVVSAGELDGLSEAALSVRLKTVAVIARSSPKTKLKVVEALKSGGEVVAVTGDGVNDAPAIKRADIGIAMGSGSEITKEASDVVLLDDSFPTIVKAVSFGRNIYRNFQRFITFQLTVNVTSMIVVLLSLALGLNNPFNAVQLLWIDIIMDGPPALTLALESGDDSAMGRRPVKRTDNLLSRSMLFKIIAHGVYASAVILAEYLFDFMRVGDEKRLTAIFCLFVTFQLFNAFNCRAIGSDSLLKSVLKNKLMVVTFALTFAFQVLLTQVAGEFFRIVPLDAGEWLKIVAIGFSSVVFAEIYKFFYRFVKTRKKISFAKIN